MILSGAMKAPYVFGTLLCILLGGTLFSRIADGNANGPPRQPAVNRVLSAAPRVISISQPFDCGAAEAAVLRQISDSLAESPDTTVVVQWSEVYRAHRNSNRAIYNPELRVLRCERLGNRPYDYTPVTPEAIVRALGESDDSAFFADANLYSLGRTDRGTATFR